MSKRQKCKDCTEKLCCIYAKLVECYGKVRADNFYCVMENEEDYEA